MKRLMAVVRFEVANFEIQQRLRIGFLSPQGNNMEMVPSLASLP
jgi:hypothetical protein